MAVPANKQELLAAIESNYDRLALDLARVTPEQSALEIMEGHAKGTMMSVHDLVAYLVGWNELVLKWCERKDQGLEVDFPETGFKWNELGALAAKFYRDYEDVPFAALLLRLETAKNALVALVAARSNTELYGVQWYEKYTLGRMIQFNTSSPYANARTRLRKWLKAQV
ncbi:ClbS/DfsB family four-helix bundle protein [Brucella gallinifaecis]|uniref:ClbS/DfsB family four-helix bundle protein n=1 Tax=Brucella gallinifaecis TaxID=215590 RepID=A0A502BLP0_9HYPH|nr:ClbS/DfsB family four-helix bundle protein [Brucella gallinifaecis]TPF74860.1 ClbS/DfsB family four-helix bundle protein [Brucella gallinifaecis]